MAGQAGSLFSQRNAMLGGLLNDQLDREQGAMNNAAQRKNSFINSLLGNAGGVASGIGKAAGFIGGLL